MKKPIIIIAVVLVAAVVAGILMKIFLFGYDAEKRREELTAQLDGLDLENVNKLMVVAHPDDEMIFGGAALIEDDYLVICITNGKNNVRASEFKEVMEKCGDKGIIMDYPDKVAGQRSDWSNCKDKIKNDINTILSYKDWEMVVTHNEAGEYGHIHHKMTHSIVDEEVENTNSSAVQYYFGKYYKKKNLPDNLDRISDELYDEKVEILKIYESQSDTIDGLLHIVPYENFVKK